MLFVLSARLSENLLSWFIIPRNVLPPCTFLSGGRSAIACSFSGSASIPLELMTCPRNLTLSVLHWHLSRLSVTPASSRCMSTASNLWVCSVWSFPWTKMSSMLHSMPSNPWRVWLLCFWNLSEPELILKGNMLKRKRPHGVMNVVSGLDSYASFICQNPEFASSFENTMEPANLPRVVSTAGSGWFSLLMYSFNLLRSCRPWPYHCVLGLYHHGSVPISGLVNSGYDTCLQHPVQIFCSFLIQGEGHLPWNWHLERSGIFFEWDTVTVLHNT